MNATLPSDQFHVAIVGRPNVGKSTLFNRLTGRQHAIVHDLPGVTRDRREGKASLGPLRFRLTDTAGMEEADEGTLQARMYAQTQMAIEEADAVLFVVDGRDGLTPSDKQFATMLRRSPVPVILVVNKAESKVAQGGVLESYSLGLGDPVCISAAHGEGMADLYDALAPHAEEWDFKNEARIAAEEHAAKENGELPAEGEEEDLPIMQLAVVGRPNVGKSTLINTMIGEERLLTGPEAGITRDAIAVDYLFEGKPLRLVDTAGMRRKAHVKEKLEYLSVGDSLRSIRYAHVVALVLDATQPLEKQDVTIASLVEQEGRALMIVVNKSDLIQDITLFKKQFEKRLVDVLAQVKGVPVVMVSALEKKGLKQIFKTAFQTFHTWNRRVTTGELNRWLAEMVDRNPPPLVENCRIKLRYMTQNKARPPSFVIFCSKADHLPESYIRYLTNGLRERFNMPGVPIRIVLRQNKNPYVTE